MHMNNKIRGKPLIVIGVICLFLPFFGGFYYLIAIGLLAIKGYNTFDFFFVPCYVGLVFIVFGIIRLVLSSRKAYNAGYETAVGAIQDVSGPQDAAIKVKGLKIGYNARSPYGGMVWQHTPNTSGGVSVALDFMNCGVSDIKYATFNFIPYDNMGDAVECTYKNKGEKDGKATGPYAPQKWFGLYWENLWNSFSIRSVKITTVNIEYMDGSRKTIPKSEIRFTVR